MKFKKSTNGNFDLPSLNKLTGKSILSTLSNISEAQKNRNDFLNENLNQNFSFPKKTLSLDEIESINFEDFMNEIEKKENKNLEYKKNIDIKEELNLQNGQKIFEEIKSQINSDSDISSEIYKKNLLTIKSITRNGFENRNFFKGSRTLDKNENTTPRNEELKISNHQNNFEIGLTYENNNFKSNTEDYVHYVYEFIENFIHENKIKHKFQKL